MILDIYKDVYYPGKTTITKYEGIDPDNGQYYCYHWKRCETSSKICESHIEFDC